MALYSLATVFGPNSLETLVDASDGDVAFTQAYDTDEDGGGGEFKFFADAMSTPWRIESLAFDSVGIGGIGTAGPPASAVTVTSGGHPFENGQRIRIEDVDTSIDGDWTIENVTTNTFDLAGSSYTTSFGPGGTASSALLQTREPHGITTVSRIRIGSSGNFDGTHESVFILDADKLSFPIDAAEAGAAPATDGYIGDGGLQVPSTASAGRWVRRVQCPIDVKWYGAKADAKAAFPDPMDPYVPSDNSLAFKAALAATPNENPAGVGGGFPLRVVANGWFYLGDTLHIVRPVLLEGVGQADPAHRPGTLLIFPTNKTGIRLHSALETDLPAGLAIDSVGASDSQIRKMTIVCKDLRGEEVYPLTGAVPANGRVGHGIHSSTVFSLHDVTVQNFAENGIHVAAESSTPELAGNAAGSHLVNTSSTINGAHGFFFVGADANVSLIEMCFADLNWGNGFRDEGGVGNSYVACYCQGNLGNLDEGTGYGVDRRNHDFFVKLDEINSSSFYGCYSEASVDHVYAPAGAFGGVLGKGSFVGGNGAGFALSSGGIVTMGPLVTEYIGDKSGPRLEIGDSTDGKCAINYITRKDGLQCDYLRMLLQESIADGRFRDWWEIQSSTGYRPSFRYPTVRSAVRSPAVWAPNGLFIGRDDNANSPIHFGVSTSIPDMQYDDSPQTYEAGDVVWTNTPDAGSPLGWICLEAGTRTTLVDVTATTTMGERDIFVTDSSRLLVGQHISISDLGSFVIDGLGLPASVESGSAGPYTLMDGQTLMVKVDAGPPQTVTFNAADFDGGDMSALTTDDLAPYIEGALEGVEAKAGGGKITLSSANHDSLSFIYVCGGTARPAFAFEDAPHGGMPDDTHVRLAEAPVSSVADKAVEFVAPVFVPFGSVGPRGEAAGQLTVDMLGANQSTDEPALYGASVVKVMSSLPVMTDLTLRFPKPDADKDAYQRTIRAALTGGDLLVDVDGGSSPVTIAAGMTATIGFDADGAYRISADV